jgi:putative endonuclease
MRRNQTAKKLSFRGLFSFYYNMNYTYILYSKSFDKYFIGQTNDVDSRLKRHNSGYVNYTKSYMPWELVLSIEKETRSEAMKLERKLKNLNREKLQKFIAKYS